MPARRWLAVTTALMAAVSTGAGCGDSDEGDHVASRDEYVDALMAESVDDSELSEDDNRCLSEAFIDAYGPEALADAGVTPDDFAEFDEPSDLDVEVSDAQGDAFYGGLTECMDVRGVFIDLMARGAALAPEEAACLEVNMTDGLIERFFVTMFTEGGEDIEDNPELMQAMITTLGPCMAPGTSGG